MLQGEALKQASSLCVGLSSAEFLPEDRDAAELAQACQKHHRDAQALLPLLPLVMGRQHHACDKSASSTLLGLDVSAGSSGCLEERYSSHCCALPISEKTSLMPQVLDLTG